MIQTIINECALHFGIRPELMTGKTRIREVIIARHSAMKIIKEIYKDKYPLKTIGKAFNRDHSSVCNAITVIGYLLDSDSIFRQTYIDLKFKCLKAATQVQDFVPDQIDKEFEHLIPEGK